MIWIVEYICEFHGLKKSAVVNIIKVDKMEEAFFVLV